MSNTKAFPVQEQSDKAQIDIYTRLKLEGMEQTSYFSVAPTNYVFNGTSVPETDGATTFAAINAVPIPTRVLMGYELRITATADVRFQIGNTALLPTIVGPNAPYHSVSKILALPGQGITASALGLVRPVKDASNVVTNKAVTIISLNAVGASSDMNFGAKHRIYFIGDSNTEGFFITTGIVTTNRDVIHATDYYHFKIRNWLNSLPGNDCRLIDKAIGGKSSSDYELFRRQGLLDLPEAPNMIFYNHGTNDVNATTYKANVKKFLNWAFDKWPDVKIVVLAPLPAQGTWPVDTGSGLDGTSRETLLAQIRTNGAAAVSEINTERSLTNQVAFINCGLAWDVADNTQYSTTEADGSHVHASVTGHTTWFNYIKTQLTANYPAFLKL